MNTEGVHKYVEMWIKLLTQQDDDYFLKGLYVTAFFTHADTDKIAIIFQRKVNLSLISKHLLKEETW